MNFQEILNSRRLHEPSSHGRISTMHLDLGLAKTINRATHVTRGFRRIVMVTAAGDDCPNRLVADLTEEFSRRGIEVSQLPLVGAEKPISSMATPAHKVLAKWSRHRQENARHELGESLDHQSAIIVADPCRLDEVVDLRGADRSDRPVVVLLATDPDKAPGDRPKRIVLLGPYTDEQLADVLVAFDRACQVVPGWSLEVCLDDESRARSAVAARRDVGIYPAGSEETIMNQSELALVVTRKEDQASRILDAASAGLPAVAHADTPAAADILSRCGYLATAELSSALAQGMADAPLRRIQRESVAEVLSDHASAKTGNAWLDLMFNVGRSRR